MASTRNINTRGNYTLERNMDKLIFNNRLYQHGSYGSAMYPALPLGGSAPPSHMRRENLSINPIEIESQLFGIGSTNLVNKYKPQPVKLKHFKNVQYFTRNQIVMPNKLVVEGCQRARPL